MLPTRSSNISMGMRTPPLTDRSWKSSQALIRFDESAEKVAEEHLKAQNMKLYKDENRNGKVRYCNGYQEGKEDSKNIDVKRRRIEDA